MTKSLPLPPRFFKCPELTQREKQHLVGKAKESAKALIDVTRNNQGPVRWEEAGAHRGVQLYKGEARYPESVVGESIMYGCGATTIQSTLDEVADFFDLSTDEKVAEFVDRNVEMLDGQLLYVLQDPSLLNEPTSKSRGHRRGASTTLTVSQVTVKWFVIDVPSKLMKNRDFLTVECQSTFVDVSGRRGWVRSYHSIKLPCCPELGDYSLVRGSFYHTGYVFVESERHGLLDVIFSAQVNMKSSVKIPAALYMTIQKKRLSSIADLQKWITRRRLGTQHFLGDLELVLKSQRKRCNVCSAKFGLIVRKARCRKCGEVVCSSTCSTEWEVPIPGQGVRKIRVCSKCAQNADLAVFEDLPPSEQFSDMSMNDDDVPMISVRAPGYQYNSKSDTESLRQLGQQSLDSDDYDSCGDHLRESGQPGPYGGSYEEIYSQNESCQDSDLEFPRLIGIEQDDLGVDSYQYTTDSGEYDEPPSTERRRDDRRYDPRNPDMHDYQTYGVSPPQYHDDEQKQALQRQQRALQRQQNKRRLLQRQQQQQETLMLRCQQQYPETDNCYVPLEDSLSSSELNESNYSSASSDIFSSFLTSSQLARHTKHMGKPGPVTRKERDAAQHAVQKQQHAKRRKAKADPPRRIPPPSVSFDRPLTQLEQLQVQRWAEQEAKFREQVIEADIPFDLELETSEISPSDIDLHEADILEDLRVPHDPALPLFFRSLHSSTQTQQDFGAPVDEFAPLFVNKAQSATNLGQRTVSVADDEDGLNNSLAELAINFNSLLRPEDLRPTEESIRLSLDSNGQDYGIESDAAIPDKADVSATKFEPNASKMTIVKLYQRILELTNKQHKLDAQPESDVDEKKEVARELEELYEKLHAEVEI
ncbi:unnamed protein product [Peronospora belbahrii]|uniref:FYVE-type domain-containing protein n=1 Tax=Peronospora belbahrii TaxID=622444 RepID=A0AAU9LB63_9STRA|nr:unnamed protein product [Peronospora belbahrii]CAH0521911.1 unnamed protein product [Peronospora belbahrii]